MCSEYSGYCLPLLYAEPALAGLLGAVYAIVNWRFGNGNLYVLLTQTGQNQTSIPIITRQLPYAVVRKCFILRRLPYGNTIANVP